MGRGIRYFEIDLNDNLDLEQYNDHDFDAWKRNKAKVRSFADKLWNELPQMNIPGDGDK